MYEQVPRSHHTITPHASILIKEHWQIHGRNTRFSEDLEEESEAQDEEEMFVSPLLSRTTVCP